MYNVQLEKDSSLAEIYQTVAMRFAFATMTKDGKSISVKQLHPFIKCRDFLGDAMWATKFKKNYAIYRFVFDGTKKSVQFDKTAMLIEYKDILALKANLKVLHHFEKAARWKRTKLIDINTKTSTGVPVYLAVGSAMWMRSPALLSLYTMLLRLAGIGINKDETVDAFIDRCSKVQSNDGRYLQYILESGKKVGSKRNPIYTIMRHSRKIFENTYEFGENATSGHVHNNHGIRSMLRYAVQYKEGQLKTDMFAAKWAKNFVDFISEDSDKKKET